MSREYRALAFTPDVEEAQRAYGSRAAQQRLDRHVGPAQEIEPLGAREREFLALQDGFYVATVSTTGWPYVQFRGGPAGFVRTPDPHTIAWADFRGNRQYITMGNVRSDPRVALIFLDYARRARLKVYGRMRVTDVRAQGHPSTLQVPGYHGVVERDVEIDVAAFDWNCDQHIEPRYSFDQLSEQLAPLRDRLASLEAENARLRAASSGPAHGADNRLEHLEPAQPAQSYDA
jgi:predicted pyridoxine 5'-phosphate oxidase superfamily flavin-nucleotide-binding protein